MLGTLQLFRIQRESRDHPNQVEFTLRPFGRRLYPCNSRISDKQYVSEPRCCTWRTLAVGEAFWNGVLDACQIVSWSVVAWELPFLILKQN